MMRWWVVVVVEFWSIGHDDVRSPVTYDVFVVNERWALFVVIKKESFDRTRPPAHDAVHAS
jgi:hypothetical protein